MKFVKTVAALVVCLMPGLAIAAGNSGILANDVMPAKPGYAGLPLKYMAAAGSNPLIIPAVSENISIPSLNQLSTEIDKNNTLIEKNRSPTSSCRLPPKKFWGNYRVSWSKAAATGGKARLKTADFNGTPEKELDLGKKEPAPPASGQSNFEIKVSTTPVATAPETLVMASKAYMVGQYESAIALYKTALAKDPKDRDALFGLATSYHRNGQKDQAKIYYAQLLEAYPYDTEGQDNFLALVGDEAPQDALAELTTLAKANPGYAPIYAHKAVIYSKLGDDQNAIKNLYHALKISSDNNDYKYNLAVLFDKNGYYANASKLYNDLIADSYKGEQIPANRQQLAERVTFINSKMIDEKPRNHFSPFRARPKK